MMFQKQPKFDIKRFNLTCCICRSKIGTIPNVWNCSDVVCNSTSCQAQYEENIKDEYEVKTVL